MSSMCFMLDPIDRVHVLMADNTRFIFLQPVVARNVPAEEHLNHSGLLVMDCLHDIYLFLLVSDSVSHCEGGRRDLHSV
jgi:hypothetical protein